MSPEVLEELKEELIEVLTRYLEIDEVGMSVELDKSMIRWHSSPAFR